MTFDEWVNKCSTNNKINSALVRSKNFIVYQDTLKEKTSSLGGVFSISERLRVYKNKLVQPYCKQCGLKKTKMRNCAFNDFCSVTCSNSAKKTDKSAVCSFDEFISSARKNNKVSAASCRGKLFEYHKDELIRQSNFLPSSTKASFRIKAISLGVTSHEPCKECGKPTALNRVDSTRLFHDFCSNKCVSRNISTKEKRKTTNIKKYGEVSWTKTKEGKSILSDSRKGVKFSQKHKDNIKKAQQEKIWSEKTMDIMNNKDKFSKLFDGRSPVTIAEELGVSHGSIINYAKKYEVHGEFINQQGIGQTSKPEEELQAFISEALPSDKIYNNSRKLLNPRELDIFIPDRNIAIEMNGVYWHSEQKGKDKKYHLSKTQECESKDTRLYHVWDNEWNDSIKNKIWKSVLANALGSSNKIYARKCKIIQINDFAFTQQFLNENHLQGEDKSKIRYALVYDNEVVSMTTFCKSRFSKKYDWELSRFCNVRGTSVVGGASRLLSHFRKRHIGSIVSYANRRWSDGGLYRALGFQELHISAPNYFYWKNDTNKLWSRNKFQKHKLEKQLNVFDPNMTEWENMKANGYDRIWDCGNYVFCLD